MHLLPDGQVGCNRDSQGQQAQAGPALAEAPAPIHTPSGLGSWAVPCRAQETTPDPILHKPVHPAKKALAIRAQDGELPPSRSSLAPSGISLSPPHPGAPPGLTLAGAGVVHACKLTRSSLILLPTARTLRPSDADGSSSVELNFLCVIEADRHSVGAEEKATIGTNIAARVSRVQTAG